jgi:hypothetical protein
MKDLDTLPTLYSVMIDDRCTSYHRRVLTRPGPAAYGSQGPLY